MDRVRSSGRAILTLPERAKDSDPTSPAWSVQGLHLAGPFGADHGHRVLTLRGTLLHDGAPVAGYLVSIAVSYATIHVMVIRPGVEWCDFEVLLDDQGRLMHRLVDEPAIPLGADLGRFLKASEMAAASLGKWQAWMRAIVFTDARVASYLSEGVDPSTGERFEPSP